MHHLAADGDAEELVAVYMFEGDGRLSYLLPRAERPPGVSWVASTGRSVLIADAARARRERAAAGRHRRRRAAALLLPLAERGEVEAVVMLVRRVSGPFDERVGRARERRSSSRRRPRWRSCARAPRRAPMRSPAA